MDACHFLPVRLGLWCLQREKERPCCTSGLHGGATVLPSWCVSLPLLQASFLLSRWPNLRIYHCSLTTKTCFQGARFKSLDSTSDELYPPLEHYSLGNCTAFIIGHELLVFQYVFSHESQQVTQKSLEFICKVLFFNKMLWWGNVQGESNI